jgi:protein-tyrosine kinase
MIKSLSIENFPHLDYMCNEAMNTLCTNLLYCGDQNKVILITSRYAGEGKSYTSMNLLRAFGSLKKRVVLIDADLRRSSIQGKYQLEFPEPDSPGLAQYLAGLCKMEEAVYKTNVDGCYIVPVGRTVSNSLTLLSSQRMGTLIRRLRSQFDIVLIDTSPIGMIVDALEIAKHCDGSLLVVSYKRGKRKEITEAVKQLENTGCACLGTVLNNVNFKNFTSRKYYYNSEKYTKKYYKAYDSGTKSNGLFHFGKHK